MSFLCVAGSACYFCVLQGLQRPAKEQRVHRHNPPLPPNDQHVFVPSPLFCPFYPSVLLCNYQLPGIWIFYFIVVETIFFLLGVMTVMFRTYQLHSHINKINLQSETVEKCETERDPGCSCRINRGVN